MNDKQERQRTGPGGHPTEPRDHPAETGDHRAETGDHRAEPGDHRTETVERLVAAWLAETGQHDRAAAHEARTGWERGALSERAAQDLATWVTARITDTGFTEDEGPYVAGPVRITPSDKDIVHDWLRARGHRI